MNKTLGSLLCVLIAFCIGCGRGTEPTVQESDASRDALRAALQAWKEGKVAKLAQRQPPIRFVDDDCSAGLQLADFELKKPDARIRPFDTVQVELRLRTRQGKMISRVAGYQITLQPAIAVLRVDE